MTGTVSGLIMIVLALVPGALLSGAPAAVNTVRAGIEPSQARRAAPEFVLKDGRGELHRLSGFRGRVVLLDFWATTCGGCIDEIPWFVEIAKGYDGKGFVTIGVSEDIAYENLSSAEEAWTRVRPFVQRNGIPYPILMGDNEVTRKYNIQALPLTYLIDVQGRIAAVYAGVVDRGNLEENITALLAERGR
jgi:peroxiredoxin